MAGTIPLSLTQQLDEFGGPLAGGKLYLIQAGTVSTPQNGFQDSALTLAWPNPIVLDAAGRLPQFFLADGSIKVRLTDVNGVEKLVADGIIVTGASSGGGGGSPVDATTVLATGDLKLRYGTGLLDGFVRTNGRTLGNASSSATERANADTEALFIFLWNVDANLTVSTGRGASGAADYAASKTIVLPDWRGRVIAGLDDMGNTAAGRLTTSYFGSTATALGASGGFESHTLTLAETPAGITTSGLNTISVANAAQAISVTNASQAITVSNASQTISVANVSQNITVANAAQAISVGNAAQAISVANASQNISVANASQNITVANASQAISVSGVNSISASGVNSITASGSNSISVASTVSDIVRHTPNLGFTPVASPGSGAYGFNTSSPSDAQITSTNGAQSISVANASQAISVANASQNITASGANSITASGTNSISASGSNSITASGTNAITASGNNAISASGVNSITASGSNAITASGDNAITASGSNAITASGSNTVTGTSTNTGGGAHAIMPPTMLATIYIKL